MSRVAPSTHNNERKRKKSKMLRQQSTRRWWLTDESKKKIKKDFEKIVKITEPTGSIWNREYGVIDPTSSYIVAWDLIMLVLILIISLIIPYETGFLESGENCIALTM